MTIEERLRRLVAYLLACKEIIEIPVDCNWLTLDSKGRIEAWREKPRTLNSFGHWGTKGGKEYGYVGQITPHEKQYKLLTQQWKSCIIAINETQQKAADPVPTNALIEVAEYFKARPDCWL